MSSEHLTLSNLKFAKGSRKKGKRLGRGESSGLGKTSGRGGKGQTARNGGGVRPGFEGGQMPLYRRIPKVGFTSRLRIRGINIYSLVKLSSLEVFDSGSVIDTALLVSKGLVKKASGRTNIKILDDKGTFSKKLTLKVSAISESAKARVESSGGSFEAAAHKKVEAA